MDDEHVPPHRSAGGIGDVGETGVTDAGGVTDTTGVPIDGIADVPLDVDPATEIAAWALVDPAVLEAAAARAVELLRAGGPVVAILVLLSVVGLTVVLVKLWQFRAVRIGRRRDAVMALGLHRRGRTAEALATVATARNPAAQALARAIRGVVRGLPEAAVREEVRRYGAEVLASLRVGLRTLEIISSLAPLLGLFGTVLGMIAAFQQLEAAGSQVDPAILSGGIWTALLTTAVGLAVAMPVVAVLSWLEGRVDRLAHEMDDVVTGVFTHDLSDTVGAEDDHAAPTRLRPVMAAAGE